jgi:hypothetical protein
MTMGLVGLAGCGGSEYRWVTNGNQGNFFKVPSAWDYDEISTSQNEGRPEAMPGSITPVWHVYFDSAEGTPSPEVEGDLPRDLIGNARIFTLSNYYRENYSVSSVREQLFHGIDPVYPPDDLQGRVELVSYRPIEDVEGLTGSRVVANINMVDEGDPRWLTVDGSMLFDPRTGRIFALTMECASACYEENRSAADQIAASWKVNEP